MQLNQLYDTTIADTQRELAIRVLVIPARSVADQAVLTSPTDLMNRLELDESQRFDSGPYLSGVLAALLVEKYSDQARKRVQGVVEGRQASVFGNEDPELLAFADQVSSQALVPFETSPLGPHSLADIGKMVSQFGPGTMIGVVAAGHTPLVLITVPVGIVLCGAAAGVARALYTGLQYRILKLMGLPQGTIDSVVNAAQPTAKARSAGA